MLGQLDDGPGGAVAGVRDGEHERLDVALEQGADAHRARLLGREDRRVGEADGAELAGRLAQGDDDGVGGRVVRLLDPVVGTGDHRLVDDGDGGVRALAQGQRVARLGEGLAHEQLVVHAAMLADGFRPGPPGAAGERKPNRNRPGANGGGSMTPAMTAPKRIAILTGGGDVPGLNAVIKSVVYRATEAGYDGLRHPPRLGGPDPRPPRPEPDPDYLRPLDRTNTRTIDRTGGTILHTSRTNPRKMRAAGLPPWMDEAERARYAVGDGVYDLTPRRARQHPPLGIDVLVTIGGDDTLSYSQVLVNAGVPLVAIPKTMDNDVQGTEYCIGFSTAITRAKEAINRQRTTLGSHERIGVFRIFGRDAGFSALYTAYVTSARCVIPEAPVRPRRAGATAGRRPRGEPEPLRLRHHRRGRHLEGRPDGRRRRRRRVRPPPQGERRRGAGRRAARRGPGSRRSPPS